VDDAGRRTGGAGELTAISAAAHFGHREAFRNQHVGCERGEFVHLTRLEGVSIDPIDIRVN
jgi:hypothetical protein